jgi:lipopolysaccharide assembly protein A
VVGILVVIFRITLFLVLASFIVSFISSNTSDIAIGLFPLPFEVEMPLYALGLLMLFGGLVAGGLLVSTSHISSHFRFKHERSKLLKQISAMENELASLRLERSLHRKDSPPQLILPPKANRT